MDSSRRIGRKAPPTISRMSTLRSLLQSARQQSAAFYLNFFSPKPARLNPDWLLSRSELRSIRILWPAKYEWTSAERWMESILPRFSHLVRLELVDNIPQPYKGTVVFRFEANGRASDVSIVYTDLHTLDPDCARNCALCFKMQYLRDGYDFSNVVPGGYVPDSRRLYLHLSSLRKERARQDLQFDVYGRFGQNFGREFREPAVSLLQTQKQFHFEGGMKMLPYREFLRESAHSKICIDLPGKGDFCFRLINYLALGSCVVAYPHRTMLHVPLVPGKHIVYTQPDFSDLVALCAHYLDHAAEREEIARNAREFFDLYLHKDNLALYYLRTCFDRLA